MKRAYVLVRHSEFSRYFCLVIVDSSFLQNNIHNKKRHQSLKQAWLLMDVAHDKIVHYIFDLSLIKEKKLWSIMYLK
jgi:hypothetical protein